VILFNFLLKLKFLFPSFPTHNLLANPTVCMLRNAYTHILLGVKVHVTPCAIPGHYQMVTSMFAFGKYTADFFFGGGNLLKIHRWLWTYDSIMTLHFLILCVFASRKLSHWVPTVSQKFNLQ
jgi:hypothetical protein